MRPTAMIEAFNLRPFEETEYLSVRDSRLHLEDVDLVDIAEQFGTPLFVYSRARIRDNARTLQSTFRRHLPKSNVCFASKACANLSVLALIEQEGLDLEVNSGGELLKAKQAGFDAHRLVFNGVAKSVTEIELALNPPIKAINVDSPFELQRIAGVAERLGVRARVALRGVPHVEGGSTAGNETGSARSKFGMTIQEVNQSIEFAADSPTTLAVVGLHVHIGSQMTELGLYADAARYVAKQGAHLRARFASDFGHVNIGGGFPKNYVKYNDQSPEIGYFHSAVTAEDVAATVAPILTRALGPHIEVLTEPGRAMTSDSAVCLARVECMKHRHDSTWLYLDTGYSVVPESGFGWYFHMVRANHADEQTTARFRVVGPLCDSIDVYFDAEGESKLAKLLETEPALKHHERLLRNTIVRTPPYRELPASTAPGDLVAILDTGAYQLEMASHYCGRMIPAAVMINDGGEVQRIRRRDTLEDLLDKER